MKEIYNCCSLCLKEDKHNGDHLIWNDSMQLCSECYSEYLKADEYKRKCMIINAVKRYRKEIEKIKDIIMNPTMPADQCYAEAFKYFWEGRTEDE